jgi:DNA polymerase elongation subunit (family B)
MKFSKEVQEWLDSQGKDIYKMSKDELKEFKKTVEMKIDEDQLLDLSTKLLGNGAYGAASNVGFFFYNIALASDITAESRETTRYMEHKFEDYFHNDFWKDKELHKKFGIELDQSKYNWYKNEPFTIYGDTDSCISTSKIVTNKDVINISELFNRGNKGTLQVTKNGHEIITSDDYVLNWSEDKGLYFGKVKYVMRHKVSKEKWRLRGKSGKEVIVTSDHSLIVFRDGKKLEVKPRDVLKTDKILMLL